MTLIVSALRAIDPASGLVRWEFKYPRPSFGGLLSTASGLVFAGEEDGNVMAFDAASGKNRWRLQTGAGLRRPDELHAQRQADA